MKMLVTPSREVAEEIIVRYKKELEAYPEDKDAHVFIGLAYLTLQDFERSKLYLEKAYDHFADGYDAEYFIRLSYYYVSGMVAFKEKKYDKAESEFRKLLKEWKLSPKDSKRSLDLEELIDWFPFDEAFEELVRSTSFNQIKSKLKVLERYTHAKGMDAGKPVVPVMLKGAYAALIFEALNFKPIDMSIFDGLEQVAQAHGFQDIADAGKRIEKFVLELKQYKSIDEIPDAKEKEIVSLLSDAEALSSDFTYQLLMEQLSGISNQLKNIKKKVSGNAKLPKEEVRKEKTEYEVWGPNTDFDGCTKFDDLSKEDLKKNFKKLKQKYKLLIDDRYNAIYLSGKRVKEVKIPQKDKKTKKVKCKPISIKFAKYKLLLWFLKNKDRLAEPETLYKIGWWHKWENLVPQNCKDTVKNEIYILNAMLKAIGLEKHLKIESERLLGYRCVGHYNYGLIIKSGRISSVQAHESHI